MSYAPGDCVGVDAYFRAVRHIGIVTDAVGMDGRPRVISSSAKHRGVAEEDWAEFSGGREVYPVPWYSRTSGAETVRQARLRIGREYHAALYNCEHFVRDCYGLDVRSPQARRIGYTLAGVAGAALAALGWSWRE